MIYIIGKVTGEENDGIEKFKDVQDRLKALCVKSVIPHDFISSDATHEEAMRMSIKHIITMEPSRDAVLRLDNWMESKGAKCENAVAWNIGLGLLDESDFKELEPIIASGINKWKWNYYGVNSKIAE